MTLRRASLIVLIALLCAPAAAQACSSRALGKPWHGRLSCGVQLPADAPALVTWDGVLGQSPNRGWRRWGTSGLVASVGLIALDYARRFPAGPRLVVGDLSRTRGGPFGARYGGVGHDSHQNGLDVDIYYPRRDGLEQPPERPRLVDRVRAQWLVNRAAAAGAQYVFIGPHVGLRRTRSNVQFLPHFHDNHLHLRIWPVPPLPPLTRHRPRDHHALDLVRPLVDLRDLRVAHHPL